jgi:hypothetical protein
MLRARDVFRLHMGHYIAPGHLPFAGAAVVRIDRVGRPHPEYAPWVARLREFDPWRVTFAHDLAIWQREA